MSSILTFLRVDPVVAPASAEPLRRLLATQIPSLITLWQNDPALKPINAIHIDEALTVLAAQVAASSLTSHMMNGANEIQARIYTRRLTSVFREALENALTYNLAMTLSEQEQEVAHG
jgi:hypothetical protein